MTPSPRKPKASPGHRVSRCILVLTLLVAGCGLGRTSAPVPAPTAALTPTTTVLPPSSATASATPALPAPTPTAHPDVPYGLVSKDRLLAFVGDLTAIQPYSGWRNSASSGESEARDYVAAQLESYAFLDSLGLELERQTFPVFLSVELWETRLILTVGDREVEVPVNGLRGSRHAPRLAQNFDSDGSFNDSERNPVTATGPALVIPDIRALYTAAASDIRGRVLFLDYTLIDESVADGAMDNAKQLAELIGYRPAGLVLVTHYSNRPGESHGTFVGDGGVFQWIDPDPTIPILYARLEDLAPAGIARWEDLAGIASARMVWDADVFLPGQSGNLIARIPGADPSYAVILSAHIDSPNGPGGLDNASGAAVLLEVARVLNEARLQPPVDVYLAWFGGHELGIYGSAHFVSTHQELLDRTLAMLQVDCLTVPLEGHHADIVLESWPYAKFGNEQLPWIEYLAGRVRPAGVTVTVEGIEGIVSDGGNFQAFNTPNGNLSYLDLSGTGHDSGHLHEPYETIEMVRSVSDALRDMAKVALAAALETGWDRPVLRVTPPPERRALFVATHTEPGNIAPSVLAELGMALAWEGFDVDLIPHGQVVTAAGLRDAGFVLLLPTLDYPGSADEQWTEEELALLAAYVAGGGMLVVTNSANGIAMKRTLEDVNEDSRDINALTERMGISFRMGFLDAGVVTSAGNHALVAGVRSLKVLPDNGVQFTIASGAVLAEAGDSPAIALVDYGGAGGQVLVVADIGLLMDYGAGRDNLRLVQNIAQYAAAR